ncbi:uncharacterized protein OCT59_020015 [Rhizophagus irregularis]|uniref:uncharacterized protein n=1 Tax=Rhizophagus irregularis TaxID=588596 RepID=UPI003318A78F|nr:hypothetical protein OCT59_020015 [Rhizophagus irregularis]
MVFKVSHVSSLDSSIIEDVLGKPYIGPFSHKNIMISFGKLLGINKQEKTYASNSGFKCTHMEFPNHPCALWSRYKIFLNGFYFFSTRTTFIFYTEAGSPSMASATGGTIQRTLNRMQTLMTNNSQALYNHDIKYQCLEFY